MKRTLTVTIFGLSAIIGLVAFLYPLFLPQLQGVRGFNVEAIRLDEAPVLTMILVVVCLGVLMVEVQGEKTNAKVIAALGVLVAGASVLRFLETAIPGPGGFSPIFVPIILAGYVFGARFGLLMGVLTLLTSALITGGVGPWLPYQMFVAGWVGLTAGWLPHPADKRLELGMLILFSFAWGLVYGLLLNLYFYPFISALDPATAAQETLSMAVTRYGTFYLATSFLWDLARSFGNALLVLALGLPAVRALSRFQDRIRFEIA